MARCRWVVLLLAVLVRKCSAVVIIVSGTWCEPPAARMARSQRAIRSSGHGGQLGSASGRKSRAAVWLYLPACRHAAHSSEAPCTHATRT